ncbi:Hypothetical protein NTJ_00646 [Nesidiocoris tenuis]|uniref:F-box domain-containing protein n=1 Tax=Nesidiocoris tenuis TaxID=355587 RepID=A0ABN7AAH3_9HEMI|nr:Hypothetical protein NTJ_00646 [Nesidiocoris tenuis]
MESTGESLRFDILGNLPLELVLKIVDYLSFNDVLNCQGVSLTWNGALNCDPIWRRYFDYELPDKEANFRRDFRGFPIQPCNYKQKVLNQKRILSNWYENKFERFVVKENFLFAAYDGTTLAAYSDHPKHGLLVYRIERGKPVRTQYLPIKQRGTCGVLTNTEYIVVVLWSLFIIYRISNAKKPVYKVAYILERRKGGQVGKVDNFRDALDGKYHCSVISTLDLLRIDSDICLINNTIFIYHAADRALCAWDLEKEELILKKSSPESASHFRHGLIADKEQVYFAAECISVYSSQAELQYRIDERLGFNSKLLVNRNLLVVPGVSSISGFDKYSGQRVFEMPHNSSSLLLNPRLDILYCVIDYTCDHLVLTAYDINAKQSIWEKISDNLLLYDTILVNEKCIIIPSKPELFTLIDTVTGNIVYSNDAVNNCKFLLARHDILICVDGNSTFMYVYS